MNLPIIPRFGLAGGILVGIPGCVVGLALGLVVYAPTAWAATFEVGIPAAFLGGVLGLAVGWIVVLAGRTHGTPPR